MSAKHFFLFKTIGTRSDFYLTTTTDYSREQLIDALVAQYYSFIEDGMEEDLELTLPDYKSYLEGLTHPQLVYETGCDDDNELDEFMWAHT